MSIILFLYPLCVGLLLNTFKVQVCCLHLSIFCIEVSDLTVAKLLVRRSCTWKKNSQHSQNAMLNTKGAHFNNDTQTCGLGHALNHVSICHIFLSSVLWLYKTQGLFIICAYVTDVTKFSYSSRIPRFQRVLQYHDFVCF